MRSIKSVCLLGLSIGSLLFFSPPKTYGLTAEDWIEDLEYLQNTLEVRHINLYHKISKEVFTTELSSIKRKLTSGELTQPPLALMQLFQKIGDGHTQFAYWGNPHHRFPMEFYMDKGKIYLTAVADQHKKLLGMELIAINQTPVNKIIQSLEPVLQAVENPYSQQQRMVETLGVSEMLYWLGIIDNTEEAEFYFADTKGKTYNIQLKALDSESKPQLIKIETKLAADFHQYDTNLDGLELFINKQQQTALIKLNSYPHYGMTDFAEKLKSLFEKNNIRYVIIDLRKNGGGDFFVGLTLAWGLILCDQLDWQQGIYTLIGRKTFSAGMSNAAQFRQLLNAKLVGEPTGSNPVGYQDADTFELPNSNWKIMHSKRLYRFQESPTPGVQPDILLPLDWNEFKQGRDNQLEWVLGDIEKHRL